MGERQCPMEEVGGVMAKTFLFDSFDIPEVQLIDGFESNDDRGGSTKSFSYSELIKNGIDFMPLEILTIYSKKNVVRGLHFQREKGQTKLISCISGKLFVAVVDLRVNNMTFGKWCSVIINKPSQSIYIPAGCAVGTMALADSAFICACGENVYIPKYDAGIRWDDPDINILWPQCEGIAHILSDRDTNLMTLKEMKELIRKYEER